MPGYAQIGLVSVHPIFLCVYAYQRNSPRRAERPRAALEQQQYKKRKRQLSFLSKTRLTLLYMQLVLVQ